VAFAAYGFFMIATLHAILIRLAEKHLHRPVPPKLVADLPPLLTLETLLFRMIEAGFLLLTLTLITGVLFAEAIFGKPLPWNHMTVFGFLSWLIYFALLLGRRLQGLARAQGDSLGCGRLRGADAVLFRCELRARDHPGARLTGAPARPRLTGRGYP
jgi:hypothetical protein